MYYDNENFFFGENYRSCRLHVAHTAWIFIGIECFLTFMLTGVLNLTIGRFDTLSVLLGCVFFSVLASAIYGLVIRRYVFLWPILFVKAAEGVLTVIFLLMATSFLLFERKLLMHVISMRLTTLEGQNVSHSKEQLHIIAVFAYLLGQLAYSAVSFYVFWTAMDYFRRRTLFAYRQRRMPTHDFIYRISSVRQFTRSPDRMIAECPLMLNGEAPHYEKAPSRSPAPPPAGNGGSRSPARSSASLQHHTPPQSQPLHQTQPQTLPQPLAPLRYEPFHAQRQASVPATVFRPSMERFPVPDRQRSVPAPTQQLCMRERSQTMGPLAPPASPVARRRSTTTGNDRHVTFQDSISSYDDFIPRRSSIPWNRAPNLDPQTLPEQKRSFSVPHSDRSSPVPPVAAPSFYRF